MKKTYMQPQTKVVEMGTVSFICGSQIRSERGLSYGGVDEYGEIDPD
jgi:hypothetical protein